MHGVLSILANTTFNSTYASSTLRVGHINYKGKIRSKHTHSKPIFAIYTPSKFSEKPIFRAFLDILLDLSEIDSTLTDQQIRSEVDTIIVGAQESVSTVLFIVLLMIGNNPDVQKKLYAEYVFFRIYLQML